MNSYYTANNDFYTETDEEKYNNAPEHLRLLRESLSQQKNVYAKYVFEEEPARKTRDKQLDDLMDASKKEESIRKRNINLKIGGAVAGLTLAVGGAIGSYAYYGKKNPVFETATDMTKPVEEVKADEKLANDANPESMSEHMADKVLVDEPKQEAKAPSLDTFDNNKFLPIVLTVGVAAVTIALFVQISK